MASTSEVLKEYLMSLGFKINTQQQKNWNNTVTSVTKGMLGAKAAITGFGTAALAAFEVYTDGMEKLYYMSQRTRTPINNIKAMDVAAEQFGLSADYMNGQLTRFAGLMRDWPEYKEQLKLLGVDIFNADGTEKNPLRLMIETLAQLGKIQDIHLRNARGGMFGFSPEDINTFLTAGPERMMAFADSYEAALAKTGVSLDENAKAMVKWKNAIREVENELGILAGVAAKKLSPALDTAAGYVHDTIQDFQKMVEDSEGGRDFMGRFMKWVNTEGPTSSKNFGKVTGADHWIDDARRFIVGWGHSEGWADKRLGKREGSGGDAGAPAGQSDIPGMFALLENLYGLPNGSLDALWDQESSRGKKMVNPTSGIEGHFQLNMANRKRFGVTDPNNLEQEANAGAQYLAELLQQYHGNLPQALAAWNGGTAAGRDIRNGSAETQAFVPSVLHKIEQNNTFHIVAKDPAAVERAVTNGLDKSNGDLLRNTRTVFDTPRLAQ